MSSPNTNPDWTGWVAIIAPCSDWNGQPSNRFGVWWQNAPAMERRGGYSGSYATRAEAETAARNWMDSWDMTLADFTIEHRDVNPDDEGVPA